MPRSNALARVVGGLEEKLAPHQLYPLVTPDGELWQCVKCRATIWLKVEAAGTVTVQYNPTDEPCQKE